MKLFELKNIKYKHILDIPEISFEKGKITTLQGKSGGGKTTILKLLNKMISPCSGDVLYNGSNLADINSVEHRRNVVMLSQNVILFPGTIADNLNIALKFQDKELANDQKLKDILKQLELNKKLDEDAHSLSGGEKQRLALGRILLLNPDVYMFDEPSSSLDDATEEFIIDLLTSHVKEKKKTAIIVTHSKDMAKKHSDIIFEVENARVK
jgi:putative ABC transport system ATP-binding protein